MATKEKNRTLYSHPFSKAYWRDAAAELKSTRTLVIAALLAGVVIFCKKKNKKISPIKLIGISAVLGILFYGI